VAGIDTQIDALYQLPLAEFTAARTALAKTLKSDAAREVRGLKKPTAVPWAVNQLYWKARPAYDAAMKAGQALRAAQIATLKGKKADVRAATDAHRKAITNAVHRAVELASDAANPNPDQLGRMFEALSLSASAPENPGRFTEVVAPSGFDALAGVTPAKRVQMPSPSPSDVDREETAPTKDVSAAEKRRVEQERHEQREAEARLRTATRDLERARERAQSAREALDHAEADVAAAEREVAKARERIKE
jgi:hypothetical protein